MFFYFLEAACKTSVFLAQVVLGAEEVEVGVEDLEEDSEVVEEVEEASEVEVEEEDVDSEVRPFLFTEMSSSFRM